jgi:hypothetical protein
MPRWMALSFPVTDLRTGGASSRAVTSVTAQGGTDLRRTFMKILAMLVSATTLGIGVAVLSSVGPGEAADANVIDATSFRCITSMTPVRQFYVDNLRGDLAATLAAANSPTGAVYPPGSVIQLIPGEAMPR